MKTRVSEKGQITIPKIVRTRLGIKPGQVLDVREDGGRFIASKVVEDDRVQRVYGILKMRESTDEYIEALRGPADAVDVVRRTRRPRSRR
jgi:AbrB family looped-hinge helix DNA binding protein